MNGRKPNLVRGRNPKGNRDTVVFLAGLVPPVLLRIEVAEHRVDELFGRPLRRVGEGDGVLDLVGDAGRVLGVLGGVGGVLGVFGVGDGVVVFVVGVGQTSRGG